MFDTVEQMNVNPRKTREQVQAQVERILNLYPTQLSNRRQTDLGYLRRMEAFIINLMGVCEDYHLPEELYRKAGDLARLYDKIRQKEQSAAARALSRGLAELANTGRRILLWKALKEGWLKISKP